MGEVDSLSYIWIVDFNDNEDFFRQIFFQTERDAERWIQETRLFHPDYKNFRYYPDIVWRYSK